MPGAASILCAQSSAELVTFLLALVLGAIFCSLAGLLLGGRAARRRYRRELEGAREFAGRMGRERDSALDAAKAQKRQRTDMFERIEGIIAERDGWQRIHHQESVAHGAAETMLFNERWRLLRQLKQARIKPNSDPQVEEVVRSFEAEYAAPARKSLEEASGKPVEVAPLKPSEELESATDD